MSYENVPKNLTEQAVLIREGRPDYLKLEAAAFPTPTVDEIGAILENTDTGDRYRWTSTNWIQIQSRATPKVIAVDYLAYVSAGRIPGEVTKAVPIRSVDTTVAFADLWGQAASMIYPTVAESWEIVSTSANDASAGTGARTVIVFYQDINRVEKNVTVTMNGVTPVTLAGGADFYRPDTAAVISSGSLQFNDGEIEIRAVGGGNPRGFIKANLSVAQDGHWSIPAGKTALLLTSQGFMPKNEDGEMIIETMVDGTNTWIRVLPVPVYQTGFDIDILARLRIAEKTDLRFRVKTTNPNVKVAAVVEQLILDNSI